MSLQTGLDGCKVGFPGGETVNQLLPLLLAKGTVCAVAHNNFSLCLVDFAVHHLGPNCSSCCMVSKEISLNSTAMPMNVSRRILAMFCSWDRPRESMKSLLLW